MTSADSRPGFNHNDFYHRFLLGRVPPDCRQALDVGCGTGQFARRLARHARAVEGVDQAPEVIATARALSRDVPNIDYFEADLASHDLGNRRYDYISCIASIHHMPFAETITRLREALTPGGVLAIVGCYRQATWVDYLPDLIAIPTNLAANAAIRAIARYRRRATTQISTAPVMPPLTRRPVRADRHNGRGAVGDAVSEAAGEVSRGLPSQACTAARPPNAPPPEQQANPPYGSLPGRGTRCRQPTVTIQTSWFSRREDYLPRHSQEFVVSRYDPPAHLCVEGAEARSKGSAARSPVIRRTARRSGVHRPPPSPLGQGLKDRPQLFSSVTGEVILVARWMLGILAPFDHTVPLQLA